MTVEPLTAAETNPGMPDSGGRERVERAVRALRAGRPAVVVGEGGSEARGDLVLAAEAVTAEWVAFAVRHGCGLMCVPMAGGELDRLQLPLMWPYGEDPDRSAFAVSVDARQGIGTGISARDRAHTIRLLGDRATRAEDLSRPGHVIPVRVRTGGVLEHPSSAEAAVDLVSMAGKRPVGVTTRLVDDDGTEARYSYLERFSRRHRLPLLDIADLIGYRERAELTLTSVETQLPTRHGHFRAVGYRTSRDDTEHLALVAGELGDGEDVLVRVHAECPTGDLFCSSRCDCGAQLDLSLERIAAEGRGVLVYLRRHEGRGIGLLQELRAHQLQEAGCDPVDADPELGHRTDALAAEILRDLGVRSMRMLSNNPDKRSAFDGYGPRVLRTVRLTAGPTGENIAYRKAKRGRTGHHTPGLSAPPSRQLPTVARAGAE